MDATSKAECLDAAASDFGVGVAIEGTRAVVEHLEDPMEFNGG